MVVIAGDFGEVQFGGSYDLVYGVKFPLSELYSFDRVRSCLRAAVDLLKPGGRFVWSTLRYHPPTASTWCAFETRSRSGVVQFSEQISTTTPVLRWRGKRRWSSRQRACQFRPRWCAHYRVGGTVW